MLLSISLFVVDNKNDNDNDDNHDNHDDDDEDLKYKYIKDKDFSVDSEVYIPSIFDNADMLLYFHKYWLAESQENTYLYD